MAPLILIQVALMPNTQIIIMVVAFILASYSIIGNDAIQAIGTFLSSNRNKPWWLLWLYTATILVVVLYYGWLASPINDASYGRLTNIGFPQGGLTWIYIIPPIAILVLTHFGIPVSTTFLLLTIFAPENLQAMVLKSLMGYFIAFAAAIVLYGTVIKKMTQRFNSTQATAPSRYWVAAQWVSTGLLWSQWLVQDLANTFVFLPRSVSTGWMIFATLIFVIGLGVIFYRRGGFIQHIVLSKTGTTDIRAAAIVDFIYAAILLVFKEWSHMPMSTTWVFLGLLAGREFAMTLSLYVRPVNETARVVRSDMTRAIFGLIVSIILAFALPYIYQLTTR